MSIPRAVFVNASSDISYRDAIFRAIRAVRMPQANAAPISIQQGDNPFQVGMKVTLLVREELLSLKQ